MDSKPTEQKLFDEPKKRVEEGYIWTPEKGLQKNTTQPLQTEQAAVPEDLKERYDYAVAIMRNMDEHWELKDGNEVIYAQYQRDIADIERIGRSEAKLKPKCPDCNSVGMSHCSDPEHCGGLYWPDRMYRDLEAALQRLQSAKDANGWQSINPDNLPKVGDELLGIDQETGDVFELIIVSTKMVEQWDAEAYIADWFTHFRPLNAPRKEECTP